jgi:hypothetical protein
MFSRRGGEERKGKENVSISNFEGLLCGFRCAKDLGAR